MQKLLMIIFTENSSLGASMLCDLAQKHGWIVDIIFIGPNDKSKILESCIQTYHPDLIAFSFKSFERKQAFEVAEQVRKSCSIKMISGGIHSTLMPDDVMDSGFFDAVVVGDGMGVFENILDNYRQLDHQIIYGSPHPDQSRYTQYFHSESQKKRMRSTQTSTILSAIGCPYDCTFC